MMIEGKRKQDVITFEWFVNNGNKDVFLKEIIELLENALDLKIYYKTEYMVPTENLYRPVDEYSDDVIFAKTQFFVFLTNYLNGVFMQNDIKRLIEQTELSKTIRQFNGVCY
jgi:hypothetical protein